MEWEEEDWLRWGQNRRGDLNTILATIPTLLLIIWIALVSVLNCLKKKKTQEEDLHQYIPFDTTNESNDPIPATSKRQPKKEGLAQRLSKRFGGQENSIAQLGDGEQGGPYDWELKTELSSEGTENIREKGKPIIKRCSMRRPIPENPSPPKTTSQQSMTCNQTIQKTAEQSAAIPTDGIDSPISETAMDGGQTTGLTGGTTGNSIESLANPTEDTEGKLRVLKRRRSSPIHTPTVSAKHDIIPSATYDIYPVLAKGKTETEDEKKKKKKKERESKGNVGVKKKSGETVADSASTEKETASGEGGTNRRPRTPLGRQSHGKHRFRIEPIPSRQNAEKQANGAKPVQNVGMINPRGFDDGKPEVRATGPSLLHQQVQNLAAADAAKSWASTLVPPPPPARPTRSYAP